MPTPTLTEPTPLEGVVRPLDDARRAFWRASWRLPLLGRAMRSVDSRVPLIAALSVTVALVLTCFAPGVLFVLGPALLGVPHVASDIRYLVLRPPLPADWRLTVAAGALALIVLRVFEMVTPRGFPFALLEVSLGWTWVALGAWMGARAAPSPTDWRRVSLVAVSIAAATAMTVAHPALARAILAYAHNLVPPIIWVVLFRGRKARAALPLALLGAGACLLLAGVTLPLLQFDDPWVAALAREARLVAPALAPSTALALGLSYVFLQAVHYSIWLVWIPQEKMRGNATLTFRMSVRAARRDFGAWGLGLIVAASLAMAVASLASVHRTRHFYLSLATFHVYLELACLAFLWFERGGGTPSSAGAADRRGP